MSEKIYKHPGIQLIRQALRRDWRQQVFFSLLLFFVMTTLLYWAFGRYSLVAAFSGVGLVFALGLLARLWRNSSPDHHPLMRLIYEEPEKVVWVYGVVTQRLPFGIQLTHAGLLYLKLVDGDDFCISLPTDKLKMVSRTLNRVLPNAVFGYTQEREEQYAIDPKSLTE